MVRIVRNRICTPTSNVWGRGTRTRWQGNGSLDRGSEPHPVRLSSQERPERRMASVHPIRQVGGVLSLGIPKHKTLSRNTQPIYRWPSSSSRAGPPPRHLRQSGPSGRGPRAGGLARRRGAQAHRCSTRHGRRAERPGRPSPAVSCGSGAAAVLGETGYTTSSGTRYRCGVKI